MISTEPHHGSAIGRLFGRGNVLAPLLVADQPAAPLRASARPTPDTIPNNHRAYAVQWFLFAMAALVIYVLALRERLRQKDAR